MATTKVSAVQIYNPYKFSVYRNAAQNTGSGAFVKVNFDTELFDTSNNFDSTTNYRFVAPVSGFYQFNTTVSMNTAVTNFVASFYKNGAEYSRGNKVAASVNGQDSVHADLIQLTAGDYIEVYVFSSATVALEVGSTVYTHFSGFLVSTT